MPQTSVNGTASVEWYPDDIITLRPNWSRAQAEKFLANIQSQLVNVQIKAGWQIIKAELSRHPAAPAL